MKRGKIIIIFIIFCGFVLLYGIYSIYRNYQFGCELYRTACKLSIQVQSLIKSIDDLEREFGNEDSTHVDYAYYNQYYEAIGVFWSEFGYEDMPVLDEVRAEYIGRIDEIRRQTMKDEDLENVFTNAEEFNKIATLRDQLKILINGLNEFVESYRQMSSLERYFTSWKDERRVLTDKVRIL